MLSHPVTILAVYITSYHILSALITIFDGQKVERELKMEGTFCYHTLSQVLQILSQLITPYLHLPQYLTVNKLSRNWKWRVNFVITPCHKSWKFYHSLSHLICTYRNIWLSISWAGIENGGYIFVITPYHKSSYIYHGLSHAICTYHNIWQSILWAWNKNGGYILLSHLVTGLANFITAYHTLSALITIFDCQ